MLGAPCRTHTLPRQISSAMIALSQYLWHIPVHLHTTSPQQLEEVHACGRVGRGEKRGEGGERGTPSDVAGITVNVITHESDNSTKVDVKSKPNQLPLLPPGRACTKSPLPRSSLHKVSSPQDKPVRSHDTEMGTRQYLLKYNMISHYRHALEPQNKIFQLKFHLK